jgi:RND family efflux transporter MFP subunit
VRAQDLIDRKTISEAIYEQRIQAKRAADAQMESAEAAVRVAELNLEFTELRAPIDGRIGDRRVSPGNLVIGGSQPSTTLLATIVSTDPIRFEFTFDEAAFLRYSRLAKDGNDIESRGTSAPVELRLLDETEFKHRGKMDFVDNVIDRASGTIRGRALLDNPSGIFTPGMFARARVPASAPFEALLVPDSAIGTEQVRKFVYAVDEEDTVRQKYVTLGHLEGGHARDPGRGRAEGPDYRERHGARTAGHQGHAVKEAKSRLAPRRRRRNRARHGPSAFLHRPPDLRVGRFHRDRDARRWSASSRCRSRSIRKSRRP